MTEREPQRFNNNSEILEGIMNSWLEENHSFVFSSKAKDLSRKGTQRTKAITQTVLTWLEDKTSKIRRGIPIRQYVDQELSGPDAYGISVLYGFFNSFETVDKSHEKFKDELSVSAFGKMVEIVKDSSATQFPQTARLPITDLVIPWTNQTTDALKKNPILLGAVMAANLYGRIYGNSFATRTQLDASERARQERIFKIISSG